MLDYEIVRYTSMWILLHPFFSFRDVMEKSFPEFYDYYLSVINDGSHLNGQSMQVGGLLLCSFK